jgi:hypothetical protein
MYNNRLKNKPFGGMIGQFLMNFIPIKEKNQNKRRET